MKVAKQLIDEGMDPEKVANMPIHFFLEIVNSRVEHKKKRQALRKCSANFLKKGGN